MLAFLPLDRAARQIASEAAHLCHLLGGTLDFLFAGSESDGMRDTVASLLHSTKIVDWELHFAEGALAASIENAAIDLKADLVVLGPPAHRSEKGVLTRGDLAKLARVLPCSMLLMPACQQDGTRFRNLAAAIKYDSSSLAMLDFLCALARRQFADRLHILREYDLYGYRGVDDPANDPKADSSYNEWKSMELYLMKDFLELPNLDHLNVTMEAIRGLCGRGAVEFASRIRANLLALPAPHQKSKFWSHFFGEPFDQLLQEESCSLLLFRDQSMARN